MKDTQSPPAKEPTKAYLEWLLAGKAGVDVAIVEAVGIMQLSVRVPETKVDAVRDLFASEWLAGWKIEVEPLGYVEPFVKRISIFA